MLYKLELLPVYNCMHTQLKAHDQHTVEAGYVLSQKGKKYVRAWYQVRQNCALYKFRAHEVRKIF